MARWPSLDIVLIIGASKILIIREKKLKAKRG